MRGLDSDLGGLDELLAWWLFGVFGDADAKAPAGRVAEARVAGVDAVPSEALGLGHLDEAREVPGHGEAAILARLERVSHGHEIVVRERRPGDR